MKVMSEELKGMRFDKELVEPSADISPHVEFWAGGEKHAFVCWKSHDSQTPKVKLPGKAHPSRSVDIAGKKVGPQFKDRNDELPPAATAPAVAPGGAPSVPGLDDSLKAAPKDESGIDHPDWGKTPWKFALTDVPVFRQYSSLEKLPKIVRGWQRLPLETVANGPHNYQFEIVFTNLLDHRLLLNGWKLLDQLHTEPWDPGQREAAYAENAVFAAPSERVVRSRPSGIRRAPSLVVEEVPFECLYGSERILLFQAERTLPLNPLRVRFVSVQGGSEDRWWEKYDKKSLEKLVAVTRAVDPKYELKPFRDAMTLTFEVSNSTGEPFSSKASLERWESDVGFGYAETNIEFKRGETQRTISFSGVDETQLEDTAIVFSEFGGCPTNLRDVRSVGWGKSSSLLLHADGDNAVASTQSLADGQPAEGASVSGTPSVGLRYRFGARWKFVRIEPKDAAARKIVGEPQAFGIWVHGDGRGGTPCIRLRDATGQVHQVRGEPITWKGWRYITFPLRPAADSGQTMIPLPDSGAEQRVT
ncbi:MAG: hypothetical protein ABMA01_23630, partial [Chthoniobacteraceae bacterium]